MYLAIMLIIVSLLVVYNEYNKNMNIAEIGLLIVALIAIIRASMNYINTNDANVTEGFSNNTKTRSRKANIKSKGRNHVDDSDSIMIDSTGSQEYFDTDTDKDSGTMSNTPETTESMLSSLNKNKIDTDAVNQVNSILGIKSRFGDITSNSSSDGIESVFVPQIQIGKGAQDSLKSIMPMYGITRLGVACTDDLASSSSALGADDGMTFPNTMKPNGNLWSSDLDYMDTSTNWSQSLNDFNNGKWNPKLYSNPSDFTDYYLASAFGMSTGNPSTSKPKPTATTRSNFGNTPGSTTLDSYGQPRKLCGAYDDFSLDQAGNLVVQNYTQAKKWMPGYTYVPPVYWDVPQRHISICQGANPNAKKLTGLVDRGLPINALEIDPEGNMADTEDAVSLTNVGSILPKFNYQETPFSKPYI